MGRVTVVFRKCVLAYKDGAGVHEVEGARVLFDLFLEEHHFSNLHADLDLVSADDLDIWSAPVVVKDNYGGFFASAEFLAAVKRYCWSFLARTPRGGWVPRQGVTALTIMEHFDTPCYTYKLSAPRATAQIPPSWMRRPASPPQLRP